MIIKNWLETCPKMETHDPTVYPTILGGVSRGFRSPFLSVVYGSITLKFFRGLWELVRTSGSTKETKFKKSVFLGHSSVWSIRTSISQQPLLLQGEVLHFHSLMDCASTHQQCIFEAFWSCANCLPASTSWMQWGDLHIRGLKICTGVHWCDEHTRGHKINQYHQYNSLVHWSWT